MRTLNRNKQPLWYANYEDLVPQYNEDGFEIGYGHGYTQPVKLMANISAAKGEAATRQFGEQDKYDKTIVIAGGSPVSETSVMWIDNLVDGEIPEENGESIPFDYIVRKVATSLNSTTLAVQKVDVSNG